MPIGSSSNMDALPGIDLTGLWWMRGNPMPEVLATFAGLKVLKTGSPFPLQFSTPMGSAFHWAYPDSIKGEAAARIFWGPVGLPLSESPDGSGIERMKWEMYSAEKGTIPIVGPFASLMDKWDFNFIDEDQWQRPTIFKPYFCQEYGGALGFTCEKPLTITYVLTRIVREDGSRTKYWSDFESKMVQDGTTDFISFKNDSPCMRSAANQWMTCSMRELYCNR